MTYGIVKCAIVCTLQNLIRRRSSFLLYCEFRHSFVTYYFLPSI